jgi:hypothetical protein
VNLRKLQICLGFSGRRRVHLPKFPPTLHELSILSSSNARRDDDALAIKWKHLSCLRVLKLERVQTHITQFTTRLPNLSQLGMKSSQVLSVDEFSSLPKTITDLKVSTHFLDTTTVFPPNLRRLYLLRQYHLPNTATISRDLISKLPTSLRELGWMEDPKQPILDIVPLFVEAIKVEGEIDRGHLSAMPKLRKCSVLIDQIVFNLNTFKVVCRESLRADEAVPDTKYDETISNLSFKPLGY